MVAFSVGEEELSGIDTKPLVGHLAAWNYFQSVETPENADFIEKWHKFTGKADRVTNVITSYSIHYTKLYDRISCTSSTLSMSPRLTRVGW